MNDEVILITDELSNIDIEVIDDYNKNMEFLNGGG